MSYPVAGQAYQPVPPSYVVASFGRRFGALLLDGIGIAVVGAIAVAALHIPGVATTTTAANGGTETTYMVTNSGWSAVSLALISAVYCISFWATSGATLGQRMLGLHVFDAAGPKPLPLQGAAVRWFVLFGIGYLIGAIAILSPNTSGVVGLGQLAWVIILAVTTYQSPTKQGWHDRAAGSYVVRG